LISSTVQINNDSNESDHYSNLYGDFLIPFDTQTILVDDRTGDVLNGFLQSTLSQFSNNEDLEIIMANLRIDQTSSLLLAIFYILSNHVQYGLPTISVSLTKNNQFAFVNIILEDCNWEEWGDLQTELSNYFINMEGKVSLTCLKALTE
jgi:hypothetical protein